ncbi:MAG TPA: TetR family transcriptional regulator [Candidatus Limnocylindrales bacterium]|nr:TetR family transcriptional regulator [Candidatus Limnocylindrales bacterium]
MTSVRSGADRARLTPRRILDVALRIVETEGVQRLSMRRLAAELDVGVATLYWHHRTKDELLAALVDDIVGEVMVAVGEPTGWRAMCETTARVLRERLRSHPGADLLIGARAPTGPNARAFLARFLATLERDGFSPRDAARIAEVVVIWASAPRAGTSQGLDDRDGSFEFGLEALLAGIARHRRSSRLTTTSRAT